MQSTANQHLCRTRASSAIVPSQSALRTALMEQGRHLKCRDCLLSSLCVFRGEAKLPSQGLNIKRQRACNKNPACSGAPCLQNGTHASLPVAQTLKQPETHPSCKTGIRYSKYTLITRCAPGEQGDTVPPRARPSECALIGADGSAVLYHNKARRVCEGKVGSLWGGCTGPRRLGMKVH